MKKIIAIFAACVMMMAAAGTTVYASESYFGSASYYGSASYSGGWIYTSYGWSYIYPGGGSPADTWMAIDGEWYYFNSYGIVQTGWLNLYGEWYYLGYDGAMKTGWINDGGSWYFLQDNGTAARGWIAYNGSWYYFSYDCTMVTGTQTIDGATYYFGYDGALQEQAAAPSSEPSTPGYATGIDYVNSKVQQYGSWTNWLIYIDTTNNWLYLYYGYQWNWSLVDYWRVSTGAASTPTVIGEFTVESKGYYFGDEDGFRCYYYTGFSGPYLMHSILYFPGTFDVMDSTIGRNVSHGCVRMVIERAKWIYENIPYGTKVVTVR